MLVRSYEGYTHSGKVGTLFALTETLVVDKAFSYSPKKTRTSDLLHIILPLRLKQILTFLFMYFLEAERETPGHIIILHS